jgi:hypothetical protein
MTTGGTFAWRDAVVAVAGVAAGGMAAGVAGLACAGTAGLGCVLAGAVTASLWAGAATGGTAAALGLDPEGYLVGGVAGALATPFFPAAPGF